ncbi:MAG: ATP synthase F1 subunit delta [Actinobacteria bacterium]|nr:ATP synthase F1 subunit delta [Actinomycetota bacterium]
MGVRAEGYAAAFYAVAEAEDAVAAVEDELHAVARALESNDELRTTLTDQAVPAELRQGIVEDLLGSRANPVTTSLVSFVVGAGRARELPAIVDAFVAKAADSRAEAVAEVRSAVALDDDQKARLAAALSKETGKKISVKVTVDPSVLGGIVAQIGDTVIDGSVRHRLDQLKESV